VRMPAERPVDAHDDPILADALVFFNNLEADPILMTEVLLGLAKENDLAGLFLAAQCLLAMPAEARPVAAVERVAAQLASWSARDEEAAQQALYLLEPLEPTRRAGVLAESWKKIGPGQGEGLIAFAADMFPESLYILLWSGDYDTTMGVGYALIETDPRLALEMARAMLEDEAQPEHPNFAERQNLAVHLLGQMPGSAAHETLLGLIKTRPDPQIRQAALRSLESSGAEITLLLLELVADAQEAPEIRGQAARMLAFSPSAQLQTGSVIREIVRISRMPLPAEAREHIQQLVETLREPSGEPAAGDILGGILQAEKARRQGGGAGRWENILNPFVAGRPVTDRHMFIGREAELHQLRAAVENGGSVFVTGERQIGKTSLLYQLLRDLRGEAAQGVPVRAAYLDLTGLAPHEFYETVLRAAIEPLGDLGMAAEGDVPRPYTDRLFERDLIALMGFLCERLGPEARLALLLDGTADLNAYPPEMHAALRRTFEQQALRGLVVILAGGPLPEAAQPFYSPYPNLLLGPLSRTDALKLVTQPVMGSFQYEPDALEAIVQAGRGRPAQLQAVCQQVINRLLEQGQRGVTLASVQEALHGAASPREQLHVQAALLLDSLLDWVETHPTAAHAQVEEQIKQAWEAVGKLMVQGAVKTRKQI
jgi:hypothetical protein